MLPPLSQCCRCISLSPLSLFLLPFGTASVVATTAADCPHLPCPPTPPGREYNHKRGFKCVFERGILHLYFNFSRPRYRR